MGNAASMMGWHPSISVSVSEVSHGNYYHKKTHTWCVHTADCMHTMKGRRLRCWYCRASNSALNAENGTSVAAAVCPVGAVEVRASQTGSGRLRRDWRDAEG